MKFNPYQQVVLDSYENGEFAYLKDHPDQASMCGDTLLHFLLIELGNSEDCHSFEEACQRVDTALCQLNEVGRALETHLED